MFIKFRTSNEAAKDTCDLLVINITEGTKLAIIIMPSMVVILFILFSFETTNIYFKKIYPHCIQIYAKYNG
jgi:hypothetical protein